MNGTVEQEVKVTGFTIRFDTLDEAARFITSAAVGARQVCYAVNQNLIREATTQMLADLKAAGWNGSFLA